MEYKDGREWVVARKGDTGFCIANFASSSRDAKELRENLDAAQEEAGPDRDRRPGVDSESGRLRQLRRGRIPGAH